VLKRGEIEPWVVLLVLSDLIAKVELLLTLNCPLFGTHVLKDTSLALLEVYSEGRDSLSHHDCVY